MWNMYCIYWSCTLYNNKSLFLMHLLTYPAKKCQYVSSYCYNRNEFILEKQSTLLVNTCQSTVHISWLVLTIILRERGKKTLCCIRQNYAANDILSYNFYCYNVTNIAFISYILTIKTSAKIIDPKSICK